MIIRTDFFIHRPDGHYPPGMDERMENWHDKPADYRLYLKIEEHSSPRRPEEFFPRVSQTIWKPVLPGE